MAEITNQKEVDETLEFLPEEAKAAFRGERETWSENVCTIEGADAWFDWCDDCSTYHQCWYVREYEVTKGVITVLIHDVDRDGNWDICDSYQVGTSEMETLDRYYGYEAWEKQYQEYLAHVAEAGDDPCCEFMVKRSLRVEEKWTVRVFQDGFGEGGGIGIYDGCHDGGPPLKAKEWPQHAKDYFLVAETETGWVTNAASGLKALSVLINQDLRPVTDIEKDGIRIDGVFEFDAMVEHEDPIPDEVVALELKQRAGDALERRKAEEKKKS